jgi:hypothetical protein
MLLVANFKCFKRHVLKSNVYTWRCVHKTCRAEVNTHKVKQNQLVTLASVISTITTVKKTSIDKTLITLVKENLWTIYLTDLQK